MACPLIFLSIYPESTKYSPGCCWSLVSSCIINIISCILGVLYLHCINLLGRLLDTTGCHDFVAFSLVSLPSISLSSSQSKKQHDTYSSTSLGYYWCKSYLSFARAEHWTVRQKTINRIYQSTNRDFKTDYAG